MWSNITLTLTAEKNQATAHPGIFWFIAAEIKEGVNRLMLEA
jgi:hypothetical protein